MTYIGIDPGANGGIGVIDTDGHVNVMAYSEEDLLNTVAIYWNPKVMVEQVHAMPGQGVTSMFNFGKAFGYILGVLESRFIPYELVTPQKWKREFSITSDKQTSIDCCRRLFPAVDLRKTEKSRKDHDGMAEALLIAEYARRHMK